MGVRVKTPFTFPISAMLKKLKVRRFTEGRGAKFGFLKACTINGRPDTDDVLPWAPFMH